MPTSNTAIPSSPPSAATHFGAFLKTLRHRQSIRQLQVLAHLPGWTQTTYSRVENDEVAPAFDQLAPIYHAVQQAGVLLTPFDRQHFLTLARLRIEAKKTYREMKTDTEWEELRLLLSTSDQKTSRETVALAQHGRIASRSRLIETRHLVGREDWLASVLASLHETFPKKLVVLQGPLGIGKSSELHRIALHFLHVDNAHRTQIILCELPLTEGRAGPESALDLFLGTLLAEVGPSDNALQTASLAQRSSFVLDLLQKVTNRFLLLLDNAEQMMDEQGHIALCWQQFLKHFLRSQHHASLVLATTTWPGWFEGERVFLVERMVPPLSADAGALLLQHLGLADVPQDYLRSVSEKVGGIPLCLEWVASLVQEPMLRNEWDDEMEYEEEERLGEEQVLTRRLQRLIEDASLFEGPIVGKLTPLLDRIIEKHLSHEAYQVLCTLALVTLPLAKPALQHVCPRPRLLKELSTASLLVAYTHRVQLLPMVASAIRTRLSIEQKQTLEETVIDAYQHWLDMGKVSDDELGAIITELAMLYLKHARLLDAAELLAQYGWLSFNWGHGPHLARLTQQVLHCLDWQSTEENECAGLVIMHILLPFLGKTTDTKHSIDYQRIRNMLLRDNGAIHGAVEGHIVHILLLNTMKELRFEEAQELLNAYCLRLKARQSSSLQQNTSLLQKQALLLATWYEYAEEQGEIQKAYLLREQTIDLYQQCVQLLSSHEGKTHLQKKIRTKRLATCLNNLGYYLNKVGRYQDALRIVEQGIALKEQGYSYVGALAASYGEKSQILMELGRFREALLFDEKAIAEIQRCADAGDMLSQEDIPMYLVNRGKLYLRLGRVDEAENLLRAALPNIPSRRRVYRVVAQEALEEIEQWRRSGPSQHYQLDWRWVGRYRELSSYDGHGWLSAAGSFTDKEQQQWNALFPQRDDETTQEQLATLMIQSRERELALALAEQREPHLYYPAIPIDEVHRRIGDLLQLDSEISQREPNVLVRRFYHGAIEEEIDFLRLIEATYEGNTEQFWECNVRLLPRPTQEEMDYVLSHVKETLQQGLQRPETIDISQRLYKFLQTRLHLSFDLSMQEKITFQEQPKTSTAAPQAKVSVQAAKRFFEAVLHESECNGWRVVVDTKTSNARIEQGLRTLFLPEKQFTLQEIRQIFLHELVGHVARCVTGEHSVLGLLGIHTKNSLPTEEGLALYHERQVAALHGQSFDESGIRIGTLTTGFACGVVTPPQTFLSLFTFLESFSLLRRLLKNPNADRQKTQEQARTYALSVCLRKFRGVPDLKQTGICYLQDAVYLHGLHMIEHAVEEDSTVLDRLGVGVCALEQLPDLQELSITSSPQRLKERAYDPDLEAYILSFEGSRYDDMHA